MKGNAELWLWISWICHSVMQIESSSKVGFHLSVQHARCTWRPVQVIWQQAGSLGLDPPEPPRA